MHSCTYYILTVSFVLDTLKYPGECPRTDGQHLISDVFGQVRPDMVDSAPLLMSTRLAPMGQAEAVLFLQPAEGVRKISDVSRDSVFSPSTCKNDRGSCVYS